MLKEITMPAGGQTTDVSTIGTWLVKKGDKVKRGDPLLEIETDKATLTVESFAKGTVLDILVEEGDEVAAGTVIAYIGEEGDLKAVGSPSADNTDKAVEEKSSDASNNEMSGKLLVSGEEEEEYQPIDKSEPLRYVKVIKAMPNAKLIARENGVSLEEVSGYTGKNILKRQDVNRYLADKEQQRKETKAEVCEAASMDEKIWPKSGR